MTTPTPTGRLVSDTDGLSLVLTRTLPGSIEDAWASITEPDRTARWMGRWEGTAVAGATVRVQLGFEADLPWTDVTIIECEAPHRLRVRMLSEGSTWELEIELTAAGERTELRFVQHRITPDEVSGVGPGWEWYLDQLTASMSDAPLPIFEDYFPAQSEYYRQQLP